MLGLELAKVSYPVGKIEYLDLCPLNFDEFLEALQQTNLLTSMQSQIKNRTPLSETEHNKLWEYYTHYLVVGGMPEVIKTYLANRENNQTLFQNIRETQQNIIQTYYADIAKHSGKQNSMHIERIWSCIPKQLGKRQDETAGKFVFKDVIPGIKGYNQLAGPID